MCGRDYLGGPLASSYWRNELFFTKDDDDEEAHLARNKRSRTNQVDAIPVDEVQEAATHTILTAKEWVSATVLEKPSGVIPSPVIPVP
ncbi:hypothetical protein Ddye_011701 [Dipteronia dyeriana]|uniref:Uncharacterized protein n=1 Tax=Dipteronia dyeriana TaxID=168575 RepID=A0AAD9X332_9ROSI|nr:hypothetical protein Ddye_011701 [Dipteronia dyeriana]